MDVVWTKEINIDYCEVCARKVRVHGPSSRHESYHNARTTDRRSTLKGMASHAERYTHTTNQSKPTVCQAKLRFVSSTLCDHLLPRDQVVGGLPKISQDRTSRVVRRAYLVDVIVELLQSAQGLVTVVAHTCQLLQDRVVVLGAAADCATQLRHLG